MKLRLEDPSLAELESEAIYVLREAAAQFDRVALLFSGGKDSIVLAYLATKAFAPAKSPFPLLHIDTGHNFDETLIFRDRFAEQFGFELIVRLVQDSIDQGKVQEETGPYASRNTLQTVTLLDAINDLHLDAVFGGARRDEEKARAKERFFSHRDIHGQWDPRNQRPEIWNLYNGRKNHGEHMRVFPLSNWTELDVWKYIAYRNIPIPDIYYTHERETVIRRGVLLAKTKHLPPIEGEEIISRRVRFRTIGDATCTGAVESEASNIEEVLQEIAVSRTTERSTRGDDKRSDTAMEDRKRQGYF